MTEPVVFDPTHYGNDLHRTIAAAQEGRFAGLSGGFVRLQPEEYVIRDTLDFTRWTGRFEGAGCGQTPQYASPGRGSVIRWDGPDDRPMLRIRDSRDAVWEHFRLEGKNGSPPTYGIEFNNNGGTVGSNEYLTVREVSIGRYPWTRQGTHKGDVRTGLGWTGTNANNDQFLIENVRVHNPIEHGADIQNSQSVGGVLRKFVVVSPGLAGVRTAASVRLDDPEFYYCNPDIETLNGAQVVIIDNIKSEHSKCLATLAPNGCVAFRGGNLQCDGVIAGDGVLIDAFPTGSLMLSLHDLNVTHNTDPSKARIEFGPASPHVGRFIIDVHRCGGIIPAQLVFADGASMWASVPESKGVVEWQSVSGSDIYQFRNELRASGRTALDYAAWDVPVTDIA